MHFNYCPYALEKKCVFNAVLKDGRDSESRIARGNSFQILGATILNAPLVLS